MASSGHLERELKLGAWPGFTMPDLSDVVPGVVVEAEQALDLDATYVDTADLELVRNGVSLRRRTGEGAPRWTLKLPAGTEAAVLARREFDVEDAAAEVPGPLADLVTGWVRSAPLVPVAQIRSHRERLLLTGDDGTRLGEIDDDEVSVVEDGHVAARFREVEVELTSAGSSELLHAVGDALVAAGAGAPDPTSKVARALGPRALAPPALCAETPADDPSVVDVATAALRRSVHRLVTHDHVVRLDDDVEGVHQARVATRRLRSDLKTLAPVLDDDWADPLRARLKVLAADLGAVRDDDVLAIRLHRAVGGLAPDDRPVGSSVIGRLDDQRRHHLDAVLETMRGDDYVRLLDELVAAALAPALGDDADRSAAKVLPALVTPRWQRLRKAVRHLDAHPSDEELHRVRILAKRSRYATEFVAPVVGDRAEGLADALAHLQDVLGDLHDCSVAMAWLRDIEPTLSRDEAFVVGQLVGAQQAEARRLRRKWKKAWKACDRKRLTVWLP